MRLIAFIMHSADTRQILGHIEVDTEPSRITPAPGLLWDDCDARVGEGWQIGPDWDLAVQPASAGEGDQRING